MKRPSGVLSAKEFNRENEEQKKIAFSATLRDALGHEDVMELLTLWLIP